MLAEQSHDDGRRRLTEHSRMKCASARIAVQAARRPCAWDRPRDPAATGAAVSAAGSLAQSQAAGSPWPLAGPKSPGPAAKAPFSDAAPAPRLAAGCRAL